MNPAGWFLVIYMSGYGGGGPTVLEFPTREACVQADASLNEATSRYEVGVCINKETGERK